VVVDLKDISASGRVEETRSFHKNHNVIFYEKRQTSTTLPQAILPCTG
jgi:hypothetical protein